MPVVGRGDAVSFFELQTEVLEREAHGGGNAGEARLGRLAEEQVTRHVEPYIIYICRPGEAAGVGVEDLVEYVAVDAKPMAYGLAVEVDVAVELLVMDKRLKTLKEFCLIVHSRLLLEMRLQK